ncbi:MAG: ABC transporter substrate-binding protein, partial [Nitrospinota bacterium]|nr:ABC transporter substrate-binding protein [Nitrospinota bacterium]
MRGKSWIPMGVLILLLTWAPVSQAVEKVKFVADWILTGPHSFLFIAREKGFYRKAGFDIDINRGRGSGNTIKWVS